jgi:ferritin
MISKKMQTAFNSQINAETYSAYLYWSMSAALETQGLHGFAHWMRVQAGEELGHAKKLCSQLIERGGVVTLKGIDSPQTEWPGISEMFRDVLKHEQKVTALIHALMGQAQSEKDYAAAVFLQWFVTEQVEEEAHAQEILQRLEMAGESKGALLMLDKEMGKRGSE